MRWNGVVGNGIRVKERDGGEKYYNTRNRPLYLYVCPSGGSQSEPPYVGCYGMGKQANALGADWRIGVFCPGFIETKGKILGFSVSGDWGKYGRGPTSNHYADIDCDDH